MSEQKPLVNYTLEAFTTPMNLTFLMVLILSMASMIVGLSFGLLPGSLGYHAMMLLGLAGASAEMFYLGLMPKDKRFVRAINAKYAADHEHLNRRIRVLSQIQKMEHVYFCRYLAFLDKKEKVLQNLSVNMGDNATLLDEPFLKKLDQLEFYYTDLLYVISQLSTTAEASVLTRLQDELENVLRDVATNEGKVRIGLQKRAEVLKKRIEKLKSSSESLKLAKIQADTIDDTIDFILSQSTTLNNAADISKTIENLIFETEEHHSSIEELDNILFEIQEPDYRTASSDEEERSRQAQQFNSLTN